MPVQRVMNSRYLIASPRLRTGTVATRGSTLKGGRGTKSANVRFGSEAHIARLFDRLVGGKQELWWNGQRCAHCSTNVLDYFLKIIFTHRPAAS
jgi:hypothetical protein